MVALFAQAWLAHLVAFAAGVALSWLLLVRPAQRRLRAAPVPAPPAAPPRPAPPPPAPPRAPAPVAPRAPAPAPPLPPPPAVDPALSTLDHGAIRAGLAATATVRLPVVAPGAFPRSARPLPDGSAPTPEHTVKGNARSMTFHAPASPHYARTVAEVWFTSAHDARAAGFTEVRDPRG